MANAATTVRVIALTILIISLVAWRTEAIDCRRYVFAAVCRGISAKRAQMAPLQYRNFHSGNKFANSMRNDDSQEEDLADYDVPQALQDEYLRTLLRKYMNRQTQALDDTDV